MPAATDWVDHRRNAPNSI